MFQRILVVLDDSQMRGCVFKTALGYAKANAAQLLIIDAASTEASIQLEHPSTLRFAKSRLSVSGTEVEITVPWDNSDFALLEMAQAWRANLLLIGHRLSSDLAAALPCSILIVQQGQAGTISMTMQAKPQPIDRTVRDHLEKLLELTPSVESSNWKK